MICSACGGENRDGAHFCRHCGASLSAPLAAVVPAPPDEEIGSGAGGEDTLAASVAEESGGAVPEAVLEGQVVGEAPAEPEAGDADREAEPAAGEPAPTGEPVIEPPAAEPEPAAELPPAEPEAATETAAPAPAPVPLQPGTLIAGRYLVLDVVEAQQDRILYRTRDLLRCWHCGFDANAADEAFCARCGAALDRKGEARLLQVRDDLAEPAGGEEVLARLSHEGAAFLVLAPGEVAAPPAPVPQGVRLVVGHSSDVGRQRELNEDSLAVMLVAPCFQSLTAPLLGLFAVADGMGGHEGGEVASKLALQVLVREVVRSIVLDELAGAAAPEEALAARLRDAAAVANDAVFLDRHKRENDMGTTLTAALVRDDRLFLAHVGDSRAYLFGAGGLVQLTADHSVVASMVASGRLRPEEIYTHPQRSVVYRSVGDRPLVEVDTAVLSLAVGDRLLLCSDGLWEMVRSEGIADALMQEADPQAACDLLVGRANAAGGEDNISVVVVQLSR